MTCLFWPMCGGQEQTRSRTHADAGAGGGTESGKHGRRLLIARRSTRRRERAERCRREETSGDAGGNRKGGRKERRFGSSVSDHQFESASPSTTHRQV